MLTTRNCVPGGSPDSCHASSSASWSVFLRSEFENVLPAVLPVLAFLSESNVVFWITSSVNCSRSNSCSDTCSSLRRKYARPPEQPRDCVHKRRRRSGRRLPDAHRDPRGSHQVPLLDHDPPRRLDLPLCRIRIAACRSRLRRGDERRDLQVRELYARR